MIFCHFLYNVIKGEIKAIMIRKPSTKTITAMHLRMYFIDCFIERGLGMESMGALSKDDKPVYDVESTGARPKDLQRNVPRGQGDRKPEAKPESAKPRKGEKSREKTVPKWKKKPSKKWWEEKL